MSYASSTFTQACVGGIVLVVVTGLPVRVLAQGTVGGGQVLELLARAFMAAKFEAVRKFVYVPGQVVNLVVG